MPRISIKDGQELVDMAIQALGQHDGEMRKVAKKACVSYWWIISLRQGKIKDPGVGKVVRVLRAMGVRLEVKDA